ncbi:MAG: flippase-like domain-containing protein [Prevotella sp.]|nr:flippase-like domain-containing protein [Prevotella sp.]
MKWTKQRLNNLFFLLGCAAVVVMLLTFDVSFVELWQHLCHAGYWLIPIIGIWLVVYALNAFAWQAIIEGNLGHKAPISFWRIYRLTITGYALNYATPVGGLGGEPYRIMELSKDIDKQHATSSVILYAMMHFFAHFWFWFISIFIYLALAVGGNLPINTAIGITLAIIVVFCLLAFYLFSKGYRNGLVKYVLGVISHIPGLKKWTLRQWARHAESIENIDHQIAALYGQDTWAFYRSLLLEYFSRVVQSAEVMFMLLLFGIDNGGGIDGLTITFLHSILIVAFTTLFANLIGFLPMQLGVQEGGFVLSIAALGLSAALGIFVSIICRVREIIWILIGMLLMKIDKQ